MKASRILYVIGSLDRGGTETHLATILPRLHGDLVKPELFLLSHRGDLADLVSSQGIVIHEPWIAAGRGKKRHVLLRLLRYGLVLVQLWLCLMRRRPEIVHFFLPMSLVIGAPAAVAARIPYRILSRRSLNTYQKDQNWIRRFEGFLIRFSQVVLGNSKAVVSQLVSSEMISQEKLGLIYNGIDLSPYKAPSTPECRLRLLGIDSDCLVFIIVANLIPYKGHADLFEALQIVNDQISDNWRLVVVGDTRKYGESVKTYAAELGLVEYVIFMGSRSDVPELLKVSDIGVLASHEEGFSNALLEYMAAGLPVVATDVGGNGEAVVHGTTGIIVPPEKPSVMAEALMKLAKDADLRRQFGTAGKRRVKEKFSLERCVRDYERLYTTILEGGAVGDVPGIGSKD